MNTIRKFSTTNRFSQLLHTKNNLLIQRNSINKLILKEPIYSKQFSYLLLNHYLISLDIKNIDRECIDICDHQWINSNCINNEYIEQCSICGFRKIIK